ncbi:MAG: hypothetical protein JNL83_26540 [Myxococcales bacterium]|nr:hypothetical protein [Myxococcales bacterium]
MWDLFRARREGVAGLVRRQQLRSASLVTTRIGVALLPAAHVGPDGFVVDLIPDEDRPKALPQLTRLMMTHHSGEATH